MSCDANLKQSLYVVFNDKDGRQFQNEGLPIAAFISPEKAEAYRYGYIQVNSQNKYPLDPAYITIQKVEIQGEIESIRPYVWIFYTRISKYDDFKLLEESKKGFVKQFEVVSLKDENFKVPATFSAQRSGIAFGNEESMREYFDMNIYSESYYLLHRVLVRDF